MRGALLEQQYTLNAEISIHQHNKIHSFRSYQFSRPPYLSQRELLGEYFQHGLIGEFGLVHRLQCVEVIFGQHIAQEAVAPLE